MRNENYPPRATFESTWALIQENAQNCKKYDQYIQEMREDRVRREEEDRMRREEDRVRREEEDRMRREEEDRKRKEEDRKRKEEDRKRKEEDRKRKEEEQKRKEKDRKRKEEEQKRMEKEQKRMEKVEKENKEWKDSFNAMIEESKREREEFKASFKAMHQEIGGIGTSNGEIAESYFVNSFSNSMYFAGQEYDTMDSNKKRKVKGCKQQAQYDLVMYNCTSIVIIEIKYKAREADVEQVIKQASTFKQFFSEYANYDIYLGLAAFHFDGNTENNALNQGIAIVKQVGDTMVINDARLKVF